MKTLVSFKKDFLEKNHNHNHNSELYFLKNMSTSTLEIFLDGLSLNQEHTPYFDKTLPIITVEQHICIDQQAGIYIHIFPNGEIYKGQWKDGRQNGFGTMINGNSDGTFTGIWKDGLYLNGTCTFEDGDVFTGQFLNGEMHHGQIRYQDGEVYNGDIAHGEPNGYGTHLYKNGHIYKGHWKDAKHHDEKGTYIFTNGQAFVGPFRDGKMCKEDRLNGSFFKTSDLNL